MEQAGYVIPTSYKAKIANILSWPIGAERLSVALAAVPQLYELTITFSDTKSSRPSWSWMTLVEATYSKRSKDIFTNPSTWKRLQMRHWSLRVHPVPRSERNELQEKILANLPQVTQWLSNHSERQAFGSLSIHIVWNKEKEMVYCSETTSIEPEFL